MNYIFNLLEAVDNADTPPTQQNYLMWIILGVAAVAIIVMSVINGKQRKKQAEEDQRKKDNLCPGTKIITIGGIVGTVVSVDNDENTYVLETEGSKIKLDKRSIYQMVLPEDDKKVEIIKKPTQEVVEQEVEETAQPIEEKEVEPEKPTAKSTKKSTKQSKDKVENKE